MLDLKPTIDELISLYTYEPSLIDFYVEGPNDKIVYDNYIKSINSHVKIIEIDTIEIEPKDSLDYNLNLQENKDKAVFLSRVFSLYKIKATVLCLVDKDLDEALSSMESNYHLMYHDYNCLESYFFSEPFLDKFISIAIRNFPYPTTKIMTEIGRVINDIFIIRVIRHLIDKSKPLLKIENNIIINKNTGNITFDPVNYLNKLIQVSKWNNRKEEILNMYSSYKLSLNSDVRYNFNGHDFIEIFFLYINKIKNTTNFRIENFERAVYLSIQPDYFNDYPIFILIKNLP